MILGSLRIEEEPVRQKRLYQTSQALSHITRGYRFGRDVCTVRLSPGLSCVIHTVCPTLRLWYPHSSTASTTTVDKPAYTRVQHTQPRECERALPWTRYVRRPNSRAIRTRVVPPFGVGYCLPFWGVWKPLSDLRYLKQRASKPSQCHIKGLFGHCTLCIALEDTVGTPTFTPVRPLQYRAWRNFN